MRATHFHRTLLKLPSAPSSIGARSDPPVGDVRAGFRYPFISVTATIAATPKTMSITTHAAAYQSPHHHGRAVEQQVPRGVKDSVDADQDPTEERIGGDGEHGENGVQRECHDG
jgi:hypothetical protein